jgi:hypothetical protein
MVRGAQSTHRGKKIIWDYPFQQIAPFRDGKFGELTPLKGQLLQFDKIFYSDVALTTAAELPYENLTIISSIWCEIFAEEIFTEMLKHRVLDGTNQRLAGVISGTSETNKRSLCCSTHCLGV